MKNIKSLLILFTGIACASELNAQGAAGAIAPSTTSISGIGGWSDPALNHNRLMQNQAGEGTWKLIGPYKVAGSPYLFGERHKADLFSADAKAYNIQVSYNTYSQEVEFYSTSNPSTPLLKEPGELDSFVIKANKAIEIGSDMKFVYGSLLGAKDKTYYLEMASGPYKLYKRYKSELTMSSTNYVQTELRVYDLQYEYFYSKPGEKGLKKLKPNPTSIIKEFKDVKDLSSVLPVEQFTANPEGSMQRAFATLNAQ